MRMYFSFEGRAAKIFKSLSMQSLVLLQVLKHDKVCDEVPLSNMCQSIDKAGRMRQAPTTLKIARGSEIRRIEDARVCLNRQLS